MRRREFVAGVLASGLAVERLGAKEHNHDDRPPVGPLASATVSFGAWPSEPPFDRLLLPPSDPPPPPPPNVHQLIPNVVTIKEGGTVNFIVAGFHNIAVYGPGTKPSDIQAGITTPVPGAPPGFPLLINDAENRIYRGLNPRGLPLDRVEVVHFSKRGTYLVICAFLPHFLDDMYGWVRVIR